ncbi:MAG TPA: hypothetical protein P5081_03790 [Phycisphaerae bacterium]|nr:hypothetical protein [Phycisphaerae bacterium]HRW51981.1 hypothetical protein [Phycisphaerae bacterium]
MAADQSRNFRIRPVRRGLSSCAANSLVILSIGLFCVRSAIAAPDVCDASRARLAGAGTPEARRTATIALAECLVNRAAAPGLAAELIGDKSHRAALKAALDEAANLLTSDAVAIPSAESETLASQKRRVELLRAFLQVFQAIAAADGSEASNDALMSACVELAIYTDNANDEIVSAAKLWQSAAYRRAGRADRTLQMMRPALGRSNGVASDFYARIERCHALADAGQFVGAIALAAKIDGRIDEWMIEAPQATRVSARRTATMTRVTLYRRWSAALAKEGLDARAADAEKSATELEASIRDDSHADLALDNAIAELPPIDTKGDADAESASK